MVARLIEERRASLERLLDGWSPEQYDELSTLLTRFARELAASRSRRSPAPGRRGRGRGGQGAGEFAGRRTRREASNGHLALAGRVERGR